MDFSKPPGLAPGQPAAKPPKRNWALITTFIVMAGGLVVVGLGFTVGFLWVKGILKKGPPQFDPKIKLVKVAALDRGWASFKVEGAHMSLEFADSHTKNTYQYDASDRIAVESYFSYEGSLDEATVYLDGVLVRAGGLYTSEDLVDCIEEQYKGEPEYEGFKFDSEKLRIHGAPAAKVVGKGKYGSRTLFVHCFAFVHHSRVIQVDVQSYIES